MRPGSLSKKDKKEARKSAKQQQRAAINYHLQAQGVDGMGRKAGLRLLQEQERQNNKRGQGFSMGITCACLQVVLWWVGCVWSMPIDAALRLVLLPLSFALLCAYSVLVSYALVQHQADPNDPRVTYPTYPALFPWRVDYTIEWNLKQVVPARLFVTMVAALASCWILAWYDGGAVLARLTEGDITLFAAMFLWAFPLLFISLGVLLVGVAMPFNVARAGVLGMRPLHLYGFYVVAELIGFLAWMWMLVFGGSAAGADAAGADAAGAGAGVAGAADAAGDAGAAAAPAPAAL